MKQKAKFIFLAAVLLPATVLLFENCGSGYSAGSLGAVGGGAAFAVLQRGNLQATVHWAVPSSGQPTSYIIEASPDGVNFTQLQTAPGSATSAVVTGLAATKYYFRVDAVNSVATTYSAPIIATLKSM
jgi:hypothetical protein